MGLGWVLKDRLYKTRIIASVIVVKGYKKVESFSQVILLAILIKIRE